MLKLHKYQEDAIAKLYKQFSNGDRNILLAAPTGSGKTLIAAKVMQDLLGDGLTCTFIVHLDVLVEQTLDKLLKFGVPRDTIGFVKAGWDANPDAPIQIGSVQTMLRRSYPVTDVFVFDEAHITCWSKVGSEIFAKPLGMARIGLTATPYRLKKTEGMGDIFDKLIQVALPSELQQRGFLSHMKYFGIHEPDTKDWKTSMGEWRAEDVDRAMNADEVMRHTIREYKRLVPEGTPSLAFCPSVVIAVKLAEAFNEAGIPSESVTAESPVKDRRELYKALDAGSIQMLTSVNVLSIGFDSPRVGCGLLYRPTKSKAIHYQQIGRIMRVHPDKEVGLILDAAGNLKKHGFPESITHYYLDHGKEPGLTGDMPIKVCEICYHIDHISAKVCGNCGNPYPEPVKPLEIKELKALDPFQKQKAAFIKMLKKAVKHKSKPPSLVVAEFYKKYKIAPKDEWFALDIESQLIKRYLLETVPNPTSAKIHQYMRLMSDDNSN